MDMDVALWSLSGWMGWLSVGTGTGRSWRGSPWCGLMPPRRGAWRVAAVIWPWLCLCWDVRSAAQTFQPRCGHLSVELYLISILLKWSFSWTSLEHLIYLELPECLVKAITSVQSSSAAAKSFQVFGAAPAKTWFWALYSAKILIGSGEFAECDLRLVVLELRLVTPVPSPRPDGLTFNICKHQSDMMFVYTHGVSSFSSDRPGLPWVGGWSR